ncbi:MAG: SsrA-binding protein SmpB [Candidatus Alcyoniella australis]|nr:SsrA-binding protein SmpB [Candidatus Alcyoniella australis]
MDDEGVKVVSRNRKARHNYAIEDTLEAGLSLQGTEVKSLREGRASLTDGYVSFDKGQAYLVSVHIDEYSHGNRFNHEPLRRRRLLLHKEEIRRLSVKVAQRGLSVVPLQIHFRRGKAKVLLGVGRGKRTQDKRETLKRRDLDREMERELRRR